MQRRKKYELSGGNQTLIGLAQEQYDFVNWTCLDEPTSILRAPRVNMILFQFYCLFVVRFNVPVNNFSVMSGRNYRFLGGGGG